MQCLLSCSGGVKAVVSKVLPVSAEFVVKWLAETARDLLPSQPIVWVCFGSLCSVRHGLQQSLVNYKRGSVVMQVHFGVDNTGEHFKLEVNLLCWIICNPIMNQLDPAFSCHWPLPAL